MPADFSNHSLGLVHAPAWQRAPALPAILPADAMAIPVPKTVNWHKAMGLSLAPADALGNRNYGCCVEAGSYRLAQLRMANAMGSSWKPRTEQVLGAYTAWTDPPFDLLSGANDSGTQVATAQQMMWSRGLDLGLQAPDVCIPVTLDHGNLDHLRRAAWMLGGIGLCLNMPLGWQTATFWNQGAGPAGSWGLHFVPTGRFAAGMWYVITWGLEIPLAEDALLDYCTGAYAFVSHNWLEADGLTPSGLSWHSLQSIRDLLSA